MFEDEAVNIFHLLFINYFALYGNCISVKCYSITIGLKILLDDLTIWIVFTKLVN
jgi:hypothetical protein